MEFDTDLKDVAESALLSLGVGGIGAAVGIAVFASRTVDKACATGTAGLGCRAVLLGEASRYAGSAGKLALVAVLAAAVVVVVDDVRGGEADA